jgi:hypothetical protein
MKSPSTEEPEAGPLQTPALTIFPPAPGADEAAKVSAV